jgi:RTX calcium-binding nonapeptide repeat (4 copies)
MDYIRQSATWTFGLACAVVTLLASAPAAEGTLQVTIEPISSQTTTFRALHVEDVTGVRDLIRVQTASFEALGPESAREQMAITDPAGFADPLPPSCFRAPPFALPGGDTTPAITCANGSFDLVSIFTGPGDDIVTSTGWLYPFLSWKQISSPSTPVFMNVFLGPGRDSFGEGGGTDLVNGDAGRDLIYGGSSNDILVGGPGADRLVAGPGDDLLLGGHGRDHCVGSGRDRGGSCERVKFEQGVDFP